MYNYIEIVAIEKKMQKSKICIGALLVQLKHVNLKM